MKFKPFLLIVIIFFCRSLIENIYAQTPNWAWANTFQDSGSVESVCIAKDNMGNIFTTGLFEGTADFDPGLGTYNLTAAGAFDMFISKLDNSGNFVWAKKIICTQGGYATSITVDDSDNVFTAGFFNGTADFDPDTSVYNLTSYANEDLFISKLDSSGKFVWAVRIGGSASDKANSIAVDDSGNVYSAGVFHAKVDFDPDTGTYNIGQFSSMQNIFILKLNPSGKLVWAKSVGTSVSCIGQSIAIDPTNNVYTTGIFRSTIDFDPDSFVTFNLTPVGAYDIFVLKLNDVGNFIWAKAMGGIYDDYGQSISIDSDENVYTTGSYRGTADFNPGLPIFNMTALNYGDIFISKLNSAGDFVWAKSIGGISDDNAQAITVDQHSNIYTTGAFIGTVDFDPNSGLNNITSNGGFDIFALKLDSSGSFIWVKTVGGTIDDSGNSLIVDDSENVYMVGVFRSDTIAFSNTILSTIIHIPTIYIAKLDNTISGIVIHESSNPFSLYPNPTNNKLTIETDLHLGVTEICIYNLLGEKSFTSTSKTSKTTIDVSALKQGLYLLQLKADDKMWSKKFNKL